MGPEGEKRGIGKKEEREEENDEKKELSRLLELLRAVVGAGQFDTPRATPLLVSRSQSLSIIGSQLSR